MIVSNKDLIQRLAIIQSDLEFELHNKEQRPYNSGLFPHYIMSICVILSLFMLFSKNVKKYFRGKQVAYDYIDEKMKPEAIIRYRRKVKNVYSSFMETIHLCGVDDSNLETVKKSEDIKNLAAGYLAIKYEGIGKDIIDNSIDRIVELVRLL